MALDTKTLFSKTLEDIDELPLAFKCTPTTDLKTAVQTLKTAQIGCLVVAEASKVLGVFTERDILTKVVGKKINLEKVVVRSFMTKNPMTVSRKTKIGDAMRVMISEKFRHLVVCEPHSTVIQIVSIRDLCHYVLSQLDDETSGHLWSKKDVA